MKHNNPIIAEMFEPENFNHYGHELIDLLTKDLSKSMSGKKDVISWQNPEAADQSWQSPIPNDPSLDHQSLLKIIQSEILEKNLAIHHPRNLGHQVAPPLPIAALCDLVAAITNQAMAVYEAGPSATLIERQVIRWLCQLIDSEQSKWHEASGILTSGGAQANLTALLAARQVSASRCNAPWNIWKEGLDHQQLCILTSAHAHYSISRAAGIMGLGTDAVIKIPTGKKGRMQIDALEKAHQRCREQNKMIIAVVASAGCTPTGSIDRLDLIGEYCQKHELWFHVDGAHGASALLSSKHRKSLNGISLADSVIWDGHKLLYMPATVSAVLFKSNQHSYAAFAQEASYLFQGNQPLDESFNTSYRTLECTKRMMGLKLWVSFSLYGTKALGELIDDAFDKAQMLADKISKQVDFELLMSPQTNIVCFRYQPPHIKEDKLNTYQSMIRKHLVESGAFYLTQVELAEKIWLRTTLMNPFTAESDLDGLINAIQSYDYSSKVA